MFLWLEIIALQRTPSRLVVPIPGILLFQGMVGINSLDLLLCFELLVPTFPTICPDSLISFIVDAYVS